VRPALFVALVFAFVGYPAAARAIPLFANAQGGVSCETCHNVPPNLNAYGRFILATNFSRGIDAHAQMKNNAREPISLLFTDDESNQNPPHVPTNYSFFDAALSGGFLGPKFSYYAAVPFVENGFPATSVYQSWIAYNGFSNGNGSLRVGKFATPFFQPWLGLPAVSLTAYAPAVLVVGQNTVGLGENRWGASYTQNGANGLIATVGYMTDQGPIESAYNSQKVLGPQFLGPPRESGRLVRRIAAVHETGFSPHRRRRVPRRSVPTRLGVEGSLHPRDGARLLRRDPADHADRDEALRP
jgi:hypothetical protein